MGRVYKTWATSGAATAQPSGAPAFTPVLVLFSFLYSVVPTTLSDVDFFLSNLVLINTITHYLVKQLFHHKFIPYKLTKIMFLTF